MVVVVVMMMVVVMLVAKMRVEVHIEMIESKSRTPSHPRTFSLTHSSPGKRKVVHQPRKIRVGEHRAGG